MSKVIDKMLRFSVYRPIPAIFLIAILTSLAGIGMKNITLNADFERELDPKTPAVVDYRAFKEVFGNKEAFLVAVYNPNGIYNQETARKIALISEDLMNMEGAYESDLASLTETKQISGDEFGLNVETLLSLEGIPETAEEFAELKRKIENDELMFGTLVSKDHTTALVFINVEKETEKPLIYAMAQHIRETYSTGDDVIYVSGGIEVNAEIEYNIAADVGRLFPIASLLVFIGFLISFRTLRGMFLPMVLIFVGVIWTIGTLGWLNFPFGSVTSILPILIVAVGGSYGVHVVFRFYEEFSVNGGEKKEVVYRAARRISPAILMTGLSTSLASGTLLIFKISSIKQFGITAAIGIFAVMILSITLLPAILSLLPTPKEKHYGRLIRRRTEDHSLLERFLISLGNLAIDRTSLVKVVFVVLMGVGIVGALKIETGENAVNFFPADHPVRVSVEFLNDKFGGAWFYNLLVDTKEEDGIKDPEVLRAVERFKAKAEKLEGVGNISSFSEIIARMNREMNGGNPEFFIIPDNRELIAQYLLLYSISGDPDDFEAIVDYDYRRTAALIPVEPSDVNESNILLGKLKELAEEEFGDTYAYTISGQGAIWKAINDYAVIGKIQNLIITFIIVSIFAAVVLRNTKYGLTAIIPLLVSTILTFGMMGFIGIRLNLATALITAVGVGIGIDFALHFIHRLREELKRNTDLRTATEATMLTTGKAIIFDALSNILGFIVFLGSFLVPVQNFGWLVSGIMLTSSLGALFFLPAFGVVIEKGIRKNNGGERLQINTEEERLTENIDTAP